MNYREKLIASSSENCLCLGLNPQEALCPIELESMYIRLLEALSSRGLAPAAFKPNIGYFSAMDRPRELSFRGSRLLCTLLDMIEDLFDNVPVILDAKRGDIARSSENYAAEAFDCWLCDAVTVSPYMGSDSVIPFSRPGKGVYILCKTSNKGSSDLQDLEMKDSRALYQSVAQTVLAWDASSEGSLGLVVGATHPEELEELAAMLAQKGSPLLIPGVGSQGSDASETMSILRRSGYDPRLARINSSSAITSPWRKTGSMPGSGWLDMCLKAFEDTARALSC